MQARCRRIGASGAPLLVALLLTLGVVAPGVVHGQEVTGRVPDGGRWLVTLRGQDESVTTVTDADGSFLMTAPRPGRYTVVAERVGAGAVMSDPVDLEAGATVAVDLDGRSLFQGLSDLTGQGSECVARPPRDTAVGRAWHHARIALGVASSLEASGEVLLDARVYRRELEPDGRTVRRQEPVEEPTGVTRLTAAADPADLVERGFVREDEAGDYRFFAPGPRVLLSDAFLESHCLRLRRDGSPALVGLAFEPLGDRAVAVPDVAGVLWMEAATGRLVMMEFAYRNFDLGISLGGAGGRMVFAELSDGTWIIPETWLRMPVLEVEAASDSLPARRWALGGVREEGVRVHRVRSGDQAWSLESPTGVLEGRVRLHEGGEPLEGARVLIPGTPYEGYSDAEGSFRIEGLLGGVYRVTARHPAFDQLLVGTGTPSVAVEEGATASIALHAPLPTEAAVELCGDAADDVSRVILSGHVTDSLTSEPLAGVPLTLRFRDPRRTGSPYHEARLTSGSGGEFVYCDLPPETRVRLRAITPRGDGDDDEVFGTPGSGVVRRDVVVALSTEQDPGGIFGTVTEFGSGRPIEAVEIRVRDGEIQALTNRNGFFAMAGLPQGLHVLEVSALGYQDREIVVRLTGSAAFKIEVQLDAEAIPLEGIVVTAVPRPMFGDMVDLHRRMELGFGDFVMQDELESRGGTLASALQGLAGVRTVSSPDRQGGQYMILRRAMDLGDAESNALHFCYPVVWVDGQRWSQRRQGGVGDEPVDFTQFLAVDIEAVEIYKGAASVPGEFGGGEAACGAVVIWTRRGGVTTRGEARGGGGDGAGGGSLP